LDGYKVVSLHWDAEGRISERDFMTGFEVDEDVIGRPADVLEGPDGSVYVSDDYAGVIYRIRRGAAKPGSANNLPSPTQKVVSDPLADLAPAKRRKMSQQGEGLFTANACGSCHRPAEAPAGMVVKPLRELSKRYTIDGMKRFLTTPTPPMPVFNLSDAEREALAVYLLEEHP
jgi:mono/diheme cytochrome c family protein